MQIYFFDKEYQQNFTKLQNLKILNTENNLDLVDSLPKL